VVAAKDVLDVHGFSKKSGRRRVIKGYFQYFSTAIWNGSKASRILVWPDHSLRLSSRLLKTKPKDKNPLPDRGCNWLQVILGAAGTWLVTLAPAQGGWMLETSERIESASSLITFVRKTVAGEHPVEIHAVFFDAKHCSLRVIDNPDERGGLDAAMRGCNCLAGVNGNYFHPDRTPLGLVISDGMQLHALEHARLLSGILTAKPGRFSLLRVAEFAPGGSITQALQAGPFLIDHGEPVPGLDVTRKAHRTVVLSDGRDKGALLVCHSATLAEMAAILATPGVISEMPVNRAMNLDGGSSTGMWVNAMPQPVYLPEFGSVRNYLALVPREK
jgi:hypothetical protein